MFKQLFELARKAGPLQLAVSADGEGDRMTVVVIPRGGAAKDEPALSTPLSLTATAEEFEAGFVQALTGYSVRRMSLEEQVAATNEVLAAAKEASVKKGAAAASKAGARTVPKAQAKPDTASGDEDDPGLDNDVGEGTDEAAGAAVASTPETAAGASSPNLFG